MTDPSKADWSQVVDILEEPREFKALVARRNFRIHVGYLLAAVWKTAKAAATVPALSANPVEALQVGVDVVAAIVATLKAVQESMKPGEFVACAVLSRDQKGMSPAELEREIRFMCAEVPIELLPWYLGLSKEFLQKALLSVTVPNTIEGLLAKLVDKGQVIVANGLYQFVDQDVQWQLS